MRKRNSAASTAPAEPRPAGARWHTPALCAAVFVFAGLLYAPTLRNGFVWDDRLLIVTNADIRHLDGPTLQRLFTTDYWAVMGRPGGLYRPLSSLSLYVDYQLFGDNPAGYHFTNVVLNGGVCVLAFLFLARLFGRTSTALMAALLFAAQPVHAENVAWVAGRTDLIAVLFMLASLERYVHWRRTGRRGAVVASVTAFVAAVLAKESAVVLPPLVTLLELGPFPRLQGGRRWVRAAVTSSVFFGIAAVFLLVRKGVLGAALLSFEPLATGVAGTAALSLSILAHYCYKLVFPFWLSAEWEMPSPASFWNVHTLAGLVIVAGLVYGTWRRRRRGEVVLAASVFAVGVAPVLNLVPLPEMAERFLYFPSLGFALAVAVLAAEGLRRWRVPVLAAFTLLTVAYGVRTVARTADWRDEDTLFRATIRSAGNSARAHSNLGATLHLAGRNREALVEFARAIELDPKLAPAWGGSALAHKQLGEMDEAFASMQRAIALEPTSPEFQNLLGVLYIQRRQFVEATNCFDRALELRPDHQRALNNLGLVMFLQEDYASAVTAFAELRHKEGEFVYAYYYMAESEARLGHADLAAGYAAAFLKAYTKHDGFERRARELVAGAAP